MSDLENQIETLESYLAGIHTCDFDEPEAVAILHVIDAARRFASLTSPETREAIAKAIWSAIYFQSGTAEWDDLLPSTKELYFSAAEAVLRSVEEGKT